MSVTEIPILSLEEVSNQPCSGCLPEERGSLFNDIFDENVFCSPESSRDFKVVKPVYHEKTHILAYPHLMANGKLKEQGDFIPQSLVIEKFKGFLEGKGAILEQEATLALDKGLCYGLNLVHIYFRQLQKEATFFQMLKDLIGEEGGVSRKDLDFLCEKVLFFHGAYKGGRQRDPAIALKKKSYGTKENLISSQFHLSASCSLSDNSLSLFLSKLLCCDKGLDRTFLFTTGNHSFTISSSEKGLLLYNPLFGKVSWKDCSMNSIEELLSCLKDSLNISKESLSFSLEVLSSENLKETKEISYRETLEQLPRSINFQGYNGCTALYNACLSNQEDIATLLIQHGANINAIDNAGNTPLLAAAYNGNQKLVDLLLKEKVNVNHRNNEGASAFLIAKQYGFDDIAQKILQSGLISLEELGEEIEGFSALLNSANFSSVPANELSLGSLLPSSVIMGAVDMSKGRRVDHELDALIVSSDPLSFQRSFADFPGSNDNTHRDKFYGGACHVNHPRKAFAYNNPVIGEPYGGVITYGNKGGPIKDIWGAGLTNVGSGGVSASSNYRNQHVELLDKRRELNVYAKDGDIRHYKKLGDEFLYLQWIKKPNGNKVFYKYDEAKRIIEIKGCDSKDKNVFGWVKISYMGNDKLPEQYFKTNETSPIQSITTSDGQKVEYSFNFRKIEKLGYKRYVSPLSSIKYSHKENRAYQWEQQGRDDRAYIRGPKGRFLSHESNFQGKAADPRFLSIRSLYAPGEKGEPKLVYRFQYEEGKCGKDKSFLKTSEAYYEGGKLVYHHSPEGRLLRIEQYKDKKGLYEKYRAKTFHWAPPDCALAGHLLSSSLENDKGKAHYCEAYYYDEEGNPIKKTVFGNLTGKKKEGFSIGNDGYPISGSAESYSKHYSYYKKSKHLHLIKEENEDNGKRTLYNYKKGTNLPYSIFTFDEQKPLTRTFHFYDEDNASLVKTITDDGNTTVESELSGVSQRKVMVYKNKERAPGFGLPKEITEKSWDFSLKKYKETKFTKLSYNRLGKVKDEEVFSSEGKSLKKHSFEYDNYGRLLSFTNEIGERKEFSYDGNGNVVKKKGPQKDRYTDDKYDYNNRLVKELNFAKEGPKGEFNSKTNSNKYNSMGREVESSDSLNHQSSLGYDFLGRLKLKEYPTGVFKGKLIRPSEKFSYNILDQLVSEKDANGRISKFRYNARGDKTFALYPDGTEEKWTYTLSGKLRTHTDTNGVKTIYRHDILGRKTSERIYSQDKFKREQKWVYNALHLLYHTDYLGNVTSYSYDLLGRESGRVSSTGLKESYFYDDLNRLTERRSFFAEGDNDYTAYHQKYDKLSRVTEESTRDYEGRILRKEAHTYNSEGEKTSHLQFHLNGKNVTSYVHYDSRNRPSKLIDEDGASTSFQYKEIVHPKFLHKKLAQSIATDPLGGKKQVTFNEYGSQSSVCIFSPKGDLLSKVSFEYDLVGNLTRELNEVYLENKKAKVRSYIIEKEYNGVGNLTKLIENPGKEQKVTAYAYDELGRLKNLKKPSGLILSHSYDEFGRLKSLSSLDGFSSCYSYDSNDNITEVKDKRGKELFITSRTYDKDSSLTSETLGNGYKLSYKYDKQSRLTSLTLQDGSSVEYSYNAQDLIQVKRLLSDQSSPYSQDFLSYDYDGKLLKSKPSESLGDTAYDYDKTGKLTSVTSQPLNYSLKYDSAGNLKVEAVEDSIGKQDLSFEYNHLYQLAKEKESEKEKHSYSYDSLGNRTGKDGEKNSHNIHNALVHSKDEKRDYDKNGNLIKVQQADKSYSLSYDSLDRLSSLVCEGKWKKSFVYDAFNRRLYEESFSYNATDETWISKGKEYFLFFGQREMGSFNQSNSLKSFRSLDPSHDSEIGAAVGIELEGKAYIPFYDHRGSVAALCDPKTSELKEAYKYDAYGQETVFDASGKELSHSALNNPWRFSSKRVCEDSKFVYFGERYYDPKQGVWITTDPNGFADGPNLYSYVHNSPLNYTDAYGLWGIDLSGIKDNISNSFSTIGGEISSAWEKANAARETTSGIAMGVLSGPIWGSAEQLSGSLSNESASYKAGHATGMALGIGLYYCGVGEARDISIGAYKGISQVAKWMYKGRRSNKAFQATKLTGITGVRQAQPLVKASQGIASSSATSSVAALKLNQRLASQEIAWGHAFEKHIINQNEFPGWIRTRHQFAELVERVMHSPSSMRSLRNNRLAYWQKESGTIVIRNPKAMDGGTAFQPSVGAEYFFKTIR
ncbi:hypothetical protein AB751O23_AP_00150 [Chlamydiales bacterium SCGC AB-751-O23]|nr:hypothetical protein AB751O23_AP_00150 [Chlamydiales bacterium SCGC AB-751-O23]